MSGEGSAQNIPGSTPGSGGGSIREAGGAFGKMEAAREDEYFYRQQKEQMKKIQSKKEQEGQKKETEKSEK